MKPLLGIGLLALVLSVGAWASTFECSDEISGYSLSVSLPGNGGMGETHGTGDLFLPSGEAVGVTCTYASGITTSLNCGGSGYQVSGAGALQFLTLTQNGLRVATLRCE
jgi:hypothetical protein